MYSFRITIDVVHEDGRTLAVDGPRDFMVCGTVESEEILGENLALFSALAVERLVEVLAATQREAGAKGAIVYTRKKEPGHGTT